MKMCTVAGHGGPTSGDLVRHRDCNFCPTEVGMNQSTFHSLGNYITVTTLPLGNICFASSLFLVSLQMAFANGPIHFYHPCEASQLVARELLVDTTVGLGPAVEWEHSPSIVVVPPTTTVLPAPLRAVAAPDFPEPGNLCHQILAPEGGNFRYHFLGLLLERFQCLTIPWFRSVLPVSLIE